MMRRESTGYSRTARTFVAIVAVVMLAGVAFTVRGRAQGNALSSSRAQSTKVVMSAVHQDVSPPLRDVPRLASFPMDAPTSVTWKLAHPPRTSPSTGGSR